MKRYRTVVQLVSPVSQKSVTDYILQQAREAASPGGIKTLHAALLFYQHSSQLDMNEVNNACIAAKKQIKARRQTPPTRATLTVNEMDMILAAVTQQGNDSIFLFALQTFLVWRYDSLKALRPTHITVEDGKINIIVIKEKCPAQQGAPREIRGIPTILHTTWHKSGRWQTVIDRLLKEKNLGGKSVLHHIPPYDVYIAEVKRMISVVAPRLHNVSGVGTHVARRTGATLHTLEGWHMRTVMYIGGWLDEEEFGKYIQAIQTITEIDQRTH